MCGVRTWAQSFSTSHDPDSFPLNQYYLGVSLNPMHLDAHGQMQYFWLFAVESGIRQRKVVILATRSQEFSRGGDPARFRQIGALSELSIWSAEPWGSGRP